MANKKMSRAAFMRSWGLDDRKVTLRYKNPLEKGVYWYYFSLFIRNRDVLEWGTCISCGKPITVETSQAGHFMPAKNCGRDLMFDQRNVNAECSQCNAFDETHLLGYAEELDKRYGEGTSIELRKRRQAHLDNKSITKDWKKEEYAQMITELTGYTQVLPHDDEQK